MKADRIDEYHKHGCNFFGKLVVISYFEDAQKDPSWGRFGASVSLDYYAKAVQYAKELYGDFDVLLGMPELVIRLKDWTVEEILKREA